MITNYILLLYFDIYLFITLISCVVLVNMFRKGWVNTIHQKLTQLLVISNFTGIPVFLGFFTKLPLLYIYIMANNIYFLVIYLAVTFFFTFFYLSFLKKFVYFNKNHINVVPLKTELLFLKLQYLLVIISIFAFIFIPYFSTILYLNLLY